jgi:RNA polymerase subunit RPABC4/transcription elongation factor Spt4
MNASTAKTLGIILVVFIVLMVVWPLKSLVFAPAGVFHGLSNSWPGLRADGDWVWPWIGFAGLFGLLFLAFWIVLIVWVYRDAEKRGMNAIVWALVVFFLHFLGLIIYMLIRSEHPVRSREPGSAGAPFAPPAAPIMAPPTCPKCGKTTDKLHTFCPACGERIKPACPACGRDVQPGWKACPNCGGSL